MARSHDLQARLQRRLALHQALHDPGREPRNRLPMLAELRRWQALRLQHSFHDLLADPRTAPAARFFLSDVYGDRDFSRRDADIARVLPMMERLLPASLLETVADAIALGALTHAFDLRMAEALQSGHGSLDAEKYARAYRQVGHPRLRMRQIDLVRDVGHDLGAALRMPGLRTLLRLSRAPAHATGFSELQGFLERGVDAFIRLGDVTHFVEQVERGERELASRLFAGDPEPFEALPR